MLKLARNRCYRHNVLMLVYPFKATILKPEALGILARKAIEKEF